MKSENKKNRKSEKGREVPAYRYYIQIAISLFLFCSVFRMIVSPVVFHTSTRHTATFTSLAVLFLLVGGYLLYDAVRGLKRRWKK